MASVVITTRNRVNDTLVAVESCLAQSMKPEVIVFDDASDDGTAEAIRTRFPEVRVIASPERRGYMMHRSEGFRVANGKYVFSIDDDAYFSDSSIVKDVVAMMEGDDKIGAVAIPYLEPLNRRSLSSLKAPFKPMPGKDMKGFIGCSHAIRRSVALDLGGYRDFFEHQGEERDFCLRLFAKRYRVVCGDCLPIVHMVSPKREHGRISHYGARNQILFDLLNLPLPYGIMWSVWHVFAMLKYRFSMDKVPVLVKAVYCGFLDAYRHRGERTPIQVALFKEWKALPGHGPMDWDGEIPSPPTYVPPPKV